MKINQNLAIHFFVSWDRESDSRTKLVVLHASDAVTLAFTSVYKDPISIELNLAEAKELSNDISKLLATRGPRTQYNVRTEGETFRTDDQSQLMIYVKTATQGEPYEEGMMLEFRRQDYTDVADFEMTYDVAGSLAKALDVVVPEDEVD
jgi:hypothetical protein